MRLSRKKLLPLLGMAGLALITGCRKEDMSDQPRFSMPYQQTAMFPDGTTARPIPVGTVARGQLRLEKDLYTGLVYDPALKTSVEVNYIPIPIGRDELLRGQEKFNIYCALCHGKLGDGGGMIVARGMIRPPSLVKVDRSMSEREINIQRAPVGHFFHVITMGYGAMYSYNDKISVADRWCIAAYVKALQLSQDADIKTFKAPPPNGAPTPVQTDTKQPLSASVAP